MASKVIAVKGEAYSFAAALTQQADRTLLQANPTLAAGDVRVSKDGGAFANIASLPSVAPAGGQIVSVQLSASEMDADAVSVLFHDVAGDEWCDLLVTMQTAAAGYDGLARADAVATLDGKVDALDGKVDSVASGVSTLDGKADAIDGKVDGVASGVSTLDGKVDALDGKVDGVASDVTAMPGSVWNRLTSALTTPGSVGEWLLAKLGLLSGATGVTVASPVSRGVVTTYRGDDYNAGDGRAIEWQVNTTASLTGGEIAVIIDDIAAFAGDVVDATTVRLELNAAQTAGIAQGSHRYEVLLTQLDSDRITLVRGVWVSMESYRAPQ